MPASRRLYVHIGLQKTGTSYLQGVMLRNRGYLASQGLDLVPATKREAFEVMVVIRNRYRARRTPAADRATMDGFARQLHEAPGGRALLSQESLGAASPEQVRRLVDACPGREVHVIATVRDLARQLPSSWQQELKAGSTVGYRRYLRRLQAMEEQGDESHPWIHLDPPAVLARWAGVVGPERVHLVTVPPPGAGSSALLERFCRVLEVDAARLEPDDGPGNTSLGRVQAEVLRRVNAELPAEVHRREVYGDVGKRFFAAQVLAAQSPRRITVPEQVREWCDRVTERQVAALRDSRYQVEGTLEDLRCPVDAFGEDDRPDERELASAAVSALSTMLTLRAAGRRTRRRAHPEAGRAGARRLLRRMARRARRGAWPAPGTTS